MNSLLTLISTGALASGFKHKSGMLLIKSCGFGMYCAQKALELTKSSNIRANLFFIYSPKKV